MCRGTEAPQITSKIKNRKCSANVCPETKEFYNILYFYFRTFLMVEKKV